MSRVQTWGSMTTEYQDSFLPPYYHRAVISTTTQKKRYHPLKGTSNDISTYRSIYVHKRMKHPKPPQPKASLPSMPPKVHPCDSACWLANQQESKTTDYTSVYKKDFQAWHTNKHQLCRMNENLKVFQGPSLTNISLEADPCQKDHTQTDLNSKAVAQKKERPPIESISSYRSDYVAHPLPQRTNRKPVTNKSLRLDPAPSFTKKVAAHTDLELSDGANELFEHFQNFSLKSKFHSRGSELAEPTFLSTTHAHYTAHQCQRTKPVLPPMKPAGKSKEPFQTTTTMREDYRTWDRARHVPVLAEEMEPKKEQHSMCRPTPDLNPNSRPSNLSFKRSKTAECNATNKPQRPAGNPTCSSFHSTSSRNDESRMYWSTSLDRGSTRPEGDKCEDPAQAHQIISYVVSSSSQGFQR